MIGMVVAVLAGATGGVLLMALLVAGRQRHTWAAECGRCHGVREAGPRRQLYLEVWDSYGNMYEKYPVGDGELLGTRPVDAQLLMDVRQVVGRLNEMSAGA